MASPSAFHPWHTAARRRRASTLHPRSGPSAVAAGVVLLTLFAVLRRRTPTVPLSLPHAWAVRQALGLNRTRRITAEHILSSAFARRIIVSESNKLIFCPVPKAANSNWKYLIRKFEHLPDYADLANAHNVNRSRLRYLSDYSAPEVHNLLHDASYFKFVFVRNPYTRLLSCYMDKFRNTDPLYVQNEYRLFLAQLFHWHYARTVDIQNEPRPSFRTFVDELLKQPPRFMNAHWMPQTTHCGIGVMPYDFIGRMENLELDARYVLDKLGKNHEHFPTQQQIGFPASGASSHLADQLYTAELRFKVRAIYAADFRILAYD